MDVPTAISQLETLIFEDFDEQGRDLVGLLEEGVREREEVVETSELLDLSAKKTQIERQCIQLKQFMQAQEDSPVLVC